jgi:putative FmdB family regulatory protein
MPSYDYECADCGPFTEARPMAEFDLPQPCPDCAQPAPRLLTAPALGGAAQQADSGAALARAHPGGCACCMPPPRLSADAV